MIRLQFEMTAPDFVEVKARHLNAAKKVGARKALEYLRDQMPKRFDGSMKAELRVETRSRAWEETKGVIRPESRGKPHKFLGRALKRAEAAEIRVGAVTSALVIRGLHAGYSTRTRTGRRNKQELARVARRERTVMAEIFARETAKELERLMKQSTKKTVI